MILEQNEKYYASANTSKGFQSFFPEIFDPDSLEKIYIIKGGPGTGKSSLMFKIARKAQDAGYHVEYFYCSSDPDSLDGILIQEKKIAILDGTSPHTTDPKYPGAVESILYTGAFWNQEKLIANKLPIMESIREKSRSYRLAYRFLSAAGEIAREIQSIALQNFKIEKMKKAAERIVQSIPKQKVAMQISTRLIASFSHKGYLANQSFQEKAQKVSIVQDHFGTAPLFLNEIAGLLAQNGHSFVKSHSCLFPEAYNALYLPEAGIALQVGEKDARTETVGKEIKYINMQRFLDKDSLRENKEKLRFLKKCYQAISGEAVSNLKDAYNAHLEIEKIYVQSMNFEKLEKMIRSISREIGV